MKFFEQYLERLEWPLLTLELRRSRRSAKIFGQMLWISIGILVIGLMAYILYRPEQFGAGPDNIFTVILAVGLALWRGAYSFFIVPSQSARLISSEKEHRSLESLVLTRLTSKEIIMQKAALPIFYSLAIAVVLLPLDLLVAVQTGSALYCLVGTVSFLCQVAMYLGIGILSSCLCDSTRSASVITYLAIIFAPIVSSSLWMTPFVSASALGPTPRGLGYDSGPGLWIASSMLITAAVAALCFFLAIKRFNGLRRSL